MDFALEETQQAVARLAAEVLDGGRPLASPAYPAVPATGPGDGEGNGYDSALWKELGQAGLLSLALIVVALVQLPEGVRMVGELLGAGPEQVRIGLPVRAEFVRIDDTLTLPAWRADHATTEAGLILGPA